MNAGSNSWPAFQLLSSLKGNFFTCDNQRAVFRVWVGGANVAHFCSPPSCFCFLLTLAACESGTGHSGFSLGVRNSKFKKKAENVRLAMSTCIYVARQLVSGTWHRVSGPDFFSFEHEGSNVRHFGTPDTDTASRPGNPERWCSDTVTCSQFIPKTSLDTWNHFGHLDTTLKFRPMQLQPIMHSHFHFHFTVECTNFG